MGNRGVRLVANLLVSKVVSPDVLPAAQLPTSARARRNVELQIAFGKPMVKRIDHSWSSSSSISIMGSSSFLPSVKHFFDAQRSICLREFTLPKHSGDQ